VGSSPHLYMLNAAVCSVTTFTSCMPPHFCRETVLCLLAGLCDMELHSHPQLGILGSEELLHHSLDQLLQQQLERSAQPASGSVSTKAVIQSADMSMTGCAPAQCHDITPRRTHACQPDLVTPAAVRAATCVYLCRSCCCQEPWHRCCWVLGCQAHQHRPRRPLRRPPTLQRACTLNCSSIECSWWLVAAWATLMRFERKSSDPGKWKVKAELLHASYPSTHWSPCCHDLHHYGKQLAICIGVRHAGKTSFELVHHWSA
jgi:hypothetical protein